MKAGGSEQLARNYTEFQQTAIEANDSDICVAAGAGSGKTGVLVERFVRLITQGKQGILPLDQCAKVDEILVITFTEKATKEMKSRIVGELNRLGMTEERRQVETAYISTIHGFCSRLLQENPFEAGVDPQFTVLDESQSRRLLMQTFDDVIARAYAENDVEITELVAEMQAVRFRRDEGGDPLAGLNAAVAMVMGKMRGVGRTREEVERFWRLGLDAVATQSLEPVWSVLTPVLDEINACLQSLRVLRLKLLGALEVAARVLEERAGVLCPRAASVSETLIALEEMQQAVSRLRLRNGALPQEVRVYEIFQRIKSVCEDISTLYGVVATQEERSAQTCHRLLGLTVATWKAYTLAKQRQGKLDTEDLQEGAVRLLEQSASVRARYRKRFRHLMIDEFQDTNPLQMRLIDLLHAPENGKSPNLLFIVGDVQQSIYGFRNADSTLFRNLEREFREKNVGLHVPLSVNFRSRPEILRLVDQIFQQVWNEARTPFVPLTPGAPFEPKPDPSVELLLTQDLGRRDYLQLEPDALATRIQQLVENRELRLTHSFDPRCGEPVAYRDVAILMRALTDIQRYEEAFARHGVPYFVVGGGRGYYARHEIRDILNILTTLDTPLDDVALLATLRSPFVGAEMDTLYRLSQYAQHPLPKSESGEARSSRPVRRPLYPALQRLLESGALPREEHEKLERFALLMNTLRKQEDRLPVGHLLERLIAQSQYDARLLCRPGGRRRLANVRKLLQMANSDSVMGVREFIRRLRDLEKISDREGDAPTEEEAADVVRFFTIHGAKGLEFPVVVLADLSRSLILQDQGPFLCDPHAMALGVKIEGKSNVVYKAIERQRHAADQEESERLLYVAMTRAREHLILCGNLGSNRRWNWADQVFQLLGVLTAPVAPETHLLTGGITARLAPLTYYANAPMESPTSALMAARQRAESQADRIADALLHDESLDSLFPM